jgi:eukaryotic-like serine/threonine-protein kinase
VTEDVRRSADARAAPAVDDRLDSWKEIAAYLKRDATTVRRWEKKEGLPVHRHLHEHRESVYAYRHEIDRWWAERRNHLADRPPDEAAVFPADARSRLAWIAVAFAVLMAGLGLVVVIVGPDGESTPAPRTVRLTFQPAEAIGDFALSPDGRLLAFTAGHEENARLWIRPLESLAPRVLAGTEGATTPFWSPDGRAIAFGAAGKLRKVSVDGGAVHTLCDARVVIGGTWNRDGVIVFTPNNRTPLHRVDAAGGVPVPVTTLDSSIGHNTHRWPHFLPDGRRFLYLARGTRPEANGIYLGSLDAAPPRRIVPAESSMEYAEPGLLLFARDGGLLALPVDPRTFAAAGDPVQVLDDILYSRDDSHAGFSISGHGELAYQTSAAVPRSVLAWFDRAGKPVAPAGTLEDTEEPSLSPDGQRVAVTRWRGASRDIWVVDLVRGPSRVTSEPSGELMPIWSPDGNSLVFASNRRGPADLYRMAASGAEPARLLLESNQVKHPSDWSAAAGVVVYESNDPETGWDLWTLPAVPGRPATPFLRTEFAEGHGRLSPDGRWMAYVSNESGVDEVYVRPFPAANGKWKISTGGGGEPRWRGDGSELFYRDAGGRLMSAAVRDSREFHAAAPQTLFHVRAGRGEWTYDVSRDGRRFVFSVPADERNAAPVVVVLNWAALLQPGAPR